MTLFWGGGGIRSTGDGYYLATGGLIFYGNGFIGGGGLTVTFPLLYHMFFRSLKFDIFLLYLISNFYRFKGDKVFFRT